MPFCPQCKYEFTEDVKLCPDCNQPLVSELPEDAPLPEIKWVSLRALPSRVYADMVTEALQNENIPSFVKLDFLQSALGISGANITGGKAIIYVPEEHRERAEEILTQMLNHI